MGLFSSKYKTVVGTSVSRLIEDRLIPDPMRSGMLKAIFQDGSIPEYVNEEIVASIASRAERMYDYGDRVSPFGLPSGEFLSNDRGASELQNVLSTLEGVPVDMEYHFSGPPNILHIAWLKLVRDHGYNPATNRIPSLDASVGGKPVYLADLVVVVPAATASTYSTGSLAQWGTPANGMPTPWNASTYAPGLGTFALPTPVSVEAVSTDYARVVYAWEDLHEVTGGGDGASYVLYNTSSFEIGNSEYDDQADYFHVKYTAGGVTKYWMYRIGSGMYPSLDAVMAEPAHENGNFFPFAYFRLNKVSMGDNPSSAEYTGSRKMCKYLGMDYQQVLGAIHENPDIGDVEQAFLSMAVPASSENHQELRYLFDFFAQVHGSELGASAPYQPGSVSGNSLLQGSLLIQDPKIKQLLGWVQVTRKRKVGSIGAVDSHAMHYLKDSSTGFVSRHTYQHQVAQNLYDEIQVFGLEMRYYVQGNYFATADETDAILMIPLDRSITEGYGPREREELYARSLHLVFNSLVIVKVKWYQQAWFSAVLQIIAVVLLIVSVGSSSAVSAALAASASAATIALIVAIEIVVTLAVSYVVGQVLRLFVKAVGVDLALIVAIVAAATGAYQVFEAGGLQAAGIMAKDLLSAASGLVKAVTSEYGAMAQDLLGEMRAFQDSSAKQLELLEKAQDLLEHPTLLQPIVIFGESPQDFFNRTVHAGNVGTIAFDALHNFADIGLMLPTFSATMGELNHGL